MAYRYDVNICCVERDKKASCAIEIKGTYKNKTQSRLIKAGFGFDGFQKAVDKSILLAILHCRHYDTIFLYTSHLPSDANSKLSQVISRIGRYEITVIETPMFLKFKAYEMIGKEEMVWEDTSLGENH